MIATSDGDFIVAWTSGYYGGTADVEQPWASSRSGFRTPPSRRRRLPGGRLTLRENTGQSAPQAARAARRDPAMEGLRRGRRDDPTLSGGRLRSSATFDDTYDLPARDGAIGRGRRPGVDYRTTPCSRVRSRVRKCVPGRIA